MKKWIPRWIYFEPGSLEYPMAQEIKNFAMDHNIEIVKSYSKITSGVGEDINARFQAAKNTLVVAVKKSLKFDVCKPSADYQFSLVTNCPGNCQYCYLYSTQGKKPYVRVYVNLEDTFNTIEKYINDHSPSIVTFEAASTGDPLALEHISGSLGKTINYFGTLDRGRLRIVSKFNNVEPILKAQHKGHTTFRFSINAPYVIQNFEHSTSPLEERLEAVKKLAQGGYPIGFIVAPIMIFDNWQHQYSHLFKNAAKALGEYKNLPIAFELIQHRFTSTAKQIITERFPNSKLDMNEETRQLKWSKYGRFKYVYPKEISVNLKDFIEEQILQNFPQGQIKYFT